MKNGDKIEVSKVLKEIRRNMRVLREQYGVRSIGVFGSYARGEQRRRSDLDIIVDYYEVPSLFEFVSLRDYLCKLTGRKVDLVRAPALKPPISKQVLKEAVYA